MVTVVDPSRERRFTTLPPAPGGFLLAAWEHMRKKPLARNAEVYTAMRSRFSGVDIVPEVVRLCAMNLYLHDIAGRDSPVEARNALLGDGGKTYDVVLINPRHHGDKIGAYYLLQEGKEAMRYLTGPVGSSRIVPGNFERKGSHETEWVLFTSGTTGLPKMVLHTLSTLFVQQPASPATRDVPSFGAPFTIFVVMVVCRFSCGLCWTGHRWSCRTRRNDRRLLDAGWRKWGDPHLRHPLPLAQGTYEPCGAAASTALHSPLR